MAQMIGADPEQLDALGSQMSGCADRLDSIRGEIASLLGHSHWDGRDANDFRGAWQGRLSGLLTAAAHATRDGASALRTNAAQQRSASESDGGFAGLGVLGRGNAEAGSFWGDFVQRYEAAGGLMNLLGLLGGLSASMAHIASGGMTDPLARALARKINDLPPGIKMWVAKDAPKLGGFTKGMEIAGKALGFLNLGIDAYGLAADIAKDPGSPEVIKSGVDVAFDVAEIATAGCPPLSFGLLAVHVGFDYLYDHPEVREAIGTGVSNAARTVAETAGAVFEGEVHLVEDVAGGAKSVVESGVNGIRGLLHL